MVINPIVAATAESGAKFAEISVPLWGWAALLAGITALLIGDLPFMSYQASVEQAMDNAGRLLQEGGAQAVKLEGGVHMAETVRRITQVGIPVVGHIGLTPQSINQLSGYKVQGKRVDEAAALVEDAKALEEAGIFSLVLEAMPETVGRRITESVVATRESR